MMNACTRDGWTKAASLMQEEILQMSVSLRCQLEAFESAACVKAFLCVCVCARASACVRAGASNLSHINSRQNGEIDTQDSSKLLASATALIDASAKSDASTHLSDARERADDSKGISPASQQRAHDCTHLSAVSLVEGRARGKDLTGPADIEWSSVGKVRDRVGSLFLSLMGGGHGILDGNGVPDHAGKTVARIARSGVDGSTKWEVSKATGVSERQPGTPAQAESLAADKRKPVPEPAHSTEQAWLGAFTWASASQERETASASQTETERARAALEDARHEEAALNLRMERGELLRPRALLPSLLFQHLFSLIGVHALTLERAQTASVRSERSGRVRWWRTGKLRAGMEPRPGGRVLCLGVIAMLRVGSIRLSSSNASPNFTRNLPLTTRGRREKPRLRLQSSLPSTGSMMSRCARECVKAI